MIRRAFVVWFCLAAASAMGASPSILERRDLGSHGVGFRVIERYDASRPFRVPTDLEGRPRKGNIARPIQIGVWYPAGKAATPPIRLPDYVALMGAEQDLTEVLAFNAELFPESANVYDSLSDAYLQVGDEPRAIELAEKCLALLEKDPSPPERKELIRRSAQEKLARLKKS
jgi:hypothetical protein